MRRALLLVAFAFALGGCGGGSNKQSEKPECPSTTTEQQASTTTVDPRCLTGAQGTSQPTTSQAKAEFWKGPVTGHGTYPGCSPAEPAVAGEVELSVDDKGVVTGHATEDIASYECDGVPADPPPNTWQITGSKTSEAFQLSVQGRSLRMDINNGNGQRASAQLDTFGSGGYGATVVYSVECIRCG
jgi:hypothetical protein